MCAEYLGWLTRLMLGIEGAIVPKLARNWSTIGPKFVHNWPQLARNWPEICPQFQCFLDSLRFSWNFACNFPCFDIGLLFSTWFMSAYFLAGRALFWTNKSGVELGAVDRNVDRGASVQNCGRDW